MKFNFLRLLTILIIVATSTSCSKDEPEPDYNKLLITHTWKAESSIAETEDPELLDRMEGIYLVLSQTQVTFNEDGTYVGESKSGTWQLSGNKIIFDANTNAMKEWVIKELNAGLLKVSLTAVLIGTQNEVNKVKVNLNLVPNK